MPAGPVFDPKFESFLQAAPDAIVVVDAQGVIVAVNALAESMFDYGRADLIGAKVEMLVPTRFRERHGGDRQAYADAPRTRPMGPGRDLWGRRRSGAEFPVQISLSPIETDQGTLVTSIIRDVTSQHRAEARFRGLLESAPDGILVVDASGTIVIVNSQLERMFGYRRDELLGRKIEMLVPQRYSERHVHDRSAYAANPRTRPMGAGKALTGRTKAGTEFPVEISLSPLQTDQEQLVMSIVRDITDRRRAEEAIEASLREKEALLREIHHRVKNNLQITSSLLRLQAGAVEDPATREVFVTTQNRIRSMALVHEKLYQSTNLARIDFSDYISALGALLMNSLASDRVALLVTGDRVYLSVDVAVPCGLIVNELFSNALKHAFPADRHGTISAHLRDEPDGRCTLTVRDDGVGLPPQTALGSGTTLGLQLIQGLVQQIDGTMTVGSSEDGSGATFTIGFPKERAHA